MRRRIIAIVVTVLGVGALLLALSRGHAATRPAAQPIAFDHQRHSQKARLDCATLCHASALTEPYAGLPSKDVCFGCHDPDEHTDSPELRRLASYAEGDADIPWQRVAWTRPDVYFSHRRHVATAKLECARCHPGVPDAAQPLGPHVLTLRMSDCLDCNRREGASHDCVACHR